jgi:CHAT domain-containing protein
VRGIARCLLVAGAQSLIVTLAPVADEASAVFVREVARALEDGAPVTECYARAQRKMLGSRPTARPALWTPFILEGQSELLR